MDTLNKIRTILGMEVNAETIDVKLEQAKLDNGAILEAEAFEAGAAVFVVSEDERIPLPVGDYTLEDGQILSVQEEGIIASIGEAAPVEEAPVEEEMATDTTPKKVVESIVKESHFSSEDFLAKLSEDQVLLQKIADLALNAYFAANAKNLSAIEEVKEIEVIEEELSAAEPRSFSPEPKEQTKVVINNRKPQTLKDRVLAKLSN